MNKKYIAGIIGIFFIVGIFVVINNGPTNGGVTKDLPKEETYKGILTGTTGDGDVAIELKPVGFHEGMFEVSISANTHSVDLSQFGLKQITTLEYNGKSIKPTFAPDLSGHHSNGILAFNLNEKPSKFTIKIIGISKTEERIYEWI